MAIYVNQAQTIRCWDKSSQIGFKSGIRRNTMPVLSSSVLRSGQWYNTEEGTSSLVRRLPNGIQMDYPLIGQLGTHHDFLLFFDFAEAYKPIENSFGFNLLMELIPFIIVSKFLWVIRRWIESFEPFFFFVSLPSVSCGGGAFQLYHFNEQWTHVHSIYLFYRSSLDTDDHYYVETDNRNRRKSITQLNGAMT